jgi:hypothetical protein
MDSTEIGLEIEKKQRKKIQSGREQFIAIICGGGETQIRRISSIYRKIFSYSTVLTCEVLL